MALYTPFAFFDFVNEFVRDHPKSGETWTLLSEAGSTRNSGVVPVRLTALSAEWYKVGMKEIAFRHVESIASNDGHCISFMLVHVPRNCIFHYKVYEDTDVVEEVGHWNA